MKFKITNKAYTTKLVRISSDAQGSEDWVRLTHGQTSEWERADGEDYYCQVVEDSSEVSLLIAYLVWSNHTDLYIDDEGLKDKEFNFVQCLTIAEGHFSSFEINSNSISNPISENYDHKIDVDYSNNIDDINPSTNAVTVTNESCLNLWLRISAGEKGDSEEWVKLAQNSLEKWTRNEGPYLLEYKFSEYIDSGITFDVKSPSVLIIGSDYSVKTDQGEQVPYSWDHFKSANDDKDENDIFNDENKNKIDDESNQFDDIINDENKNKINDETNIINDENNNKINDESNTRLATPTYKY